MIFRKRVGNYFNKLTLANNPFAGIRVEPLATSLGDHYRFTKLQTHPFIHGHDVWLNRDSHIFSEGNVRIPVSFGGFSLDNGRRLVHAVQQIIKDSVATFMNDLGG